MGIYAFSHSFQVFSHRIRVNVLSRLISRFYPSRVCKCNVDIILITQRNIDMLHLQRSQLGPSGPASSDGTKQKYLQRFVHKTYSPASALVCNKSNTHSYPRKTHWKPFCNKTTHIAISAKLTRNHFATKQHPYLSAPNSF